MLIGLSPGKFSSFPFLRKWYVNEGLVLLTKVIKAEKFSEKVRKLLNLPFLSTSNDTRYEQNAWQWFKGSEARESLSFTIKPMGVLDIAG